MTDRYPGAILLSSLFHGVVLALVIFFAYVAKQQIKEPVKVFELVAGEGDNYMATEAPALGVPGGLKVEIPEPPAALPETPRPAAVEIAPPPEPVVEKAPFKPADKPDKLVRDLKRIATKRETNVIKKYRKEEEKKAKEDAARKAKEEAAKKKMTKEEFDRLNKGKPAVASVAPSSAKVKKIDTEGIAKGVVGGSTANKTGGAGGRALTSDNADVLGAYFAMLKQRLKANLEKPPGVSDTLVAEVIVRVGADGSLTRARIEKSSGSVEFDRAVLDAIARTRMPARPDGKSEDVAIPFRMRDESDG